jgi:sulfotransferase family protein
MPVLTKPLFVLKNSLDTKFRVPGSMTNEHITIVSGLPRSGTSMMMKMLEAGGLGPLTDNIRAADEDNPKGYFEFERVKQIENDKAWLEDARGRVVKLISALVKHLPPSYNYKVIFMRRAMPEILASQRQMLIRRGEPADAVPDDKMAAMFEKHVAQVETWLAAQANIETIYVSYNDVMKDARPHAELINSFLGGTLNVDSMVGVADAALYRQRRER